MQVVIMSDRLFLLLNHIRYVMEVNYRKINVH
jgi:hypothetical protein